MNKKNSKSAIVLKYVVVGVLILSMVASVFAYLIAALQTI